MKLKNKMTIQQIANTLRVHRSSVERWIAKCQLVGGKRKKIKGVEKWVFTKQDVENYLKKCEQ